MVHDWMDLWTADDGCWSRLGLLLLEFSCDDKSLYSLYDHMRSGHDDFHVTILGHHWYNDSAPDYHLSFLPYVLRCLGQ